MNLSPDFLTPLINSWHQLRDGTRDSIIGGLVVATVVGGVVLFRKSLDAGYRRIFPKPPPASPQPQIIVNVPAPVMPAPTPSPTAVDSPHAPLIPKSPSVGFVGRQDEEGRKIVELLKEKLAPTKNQLVALWGEGGHGKTTLAAEAARALSEAFKQRIVWASADRRADFTFSTLLDEIAAQLNRSDLRQLAVEPKAAEVQSLIASAPTLVVLDNFETINAIEGQRCIEFLAEHSPYPALITTRQKVGGAYNISVDVMTLEEAKDFLARLIRDAGNKSAFAGSKDALIIEAAKRNPLVMQWVVAQIELAQLPRDVLQELAKGEGDAARRIFDRSFELEQLGEDGRAALLALSLFVPSASRPALAEVAGFGSDAARLNEAVKCLAALRLIGTTNVGERLIIQGLTRDLAKARLDKDSRDAEFRQRFVAYFLNYAEAHSQTTGEDFDMLELEKDNVLGALDVAYEMKDWQSVMRIRAALEDFLDLRGYWDEAIRRGEQALQAARYVSIDIVVAAFAHNVAKIHQHRGELAEARRLYEESLEINKNLGNQSGIASTLHNLAAIAQAQGELAEARRLYEESLEIKKSLGNQSGIASTLGQMGRLAELEGDKSKAMRLFREALSIFEKLGSPYAKLARRDLERVEGESS